MRLLHAGLLAAAGLAAAGPAAAQVGPAVLRRGYYNPGLPAQQAAAQAQVVVVAKVVAVDAEFTQARPFPSGAAGQTVGWTTATVRVADDILGAAGKTHLRVGWVPNAGGSPDIYFGGGGRIAARRAVAIRGRYVEPMGGMSLSEGQEVCLALTMHPEGDFYVAAAYSLPLVKGQGNYDDDVKAVRRVAAAVKNPLEALQAAAPADRAFAAAILVQKYRTVPPADEGRGVKQEPLPDAESKLVLKALAEMEWNKLDETGAAPLQTAFYQLALTPADGWTQPQQAAGQDYNAVMAEAVRKWFADHAAKYKVQRYVLETKRN